MQNISSTLALQLYSVLHTILVNYSQMLSDAVLNTFTPPSLPSTIFPWVAGVGKAVAGGNPAQAAYSGAEVRLEKSDRGKIHSG